MRQEHFEETARKLADAMERMHFDEYIRYATDKRRLLTINFLAGLARGFGSAIGFTILGGVVIILLRRIVDWNLPWLGGHLAELIQIVLDKLE